MNMEKCPQCATDLKDTMSCGCGWRMAPPSPAHTPGNAPNQSSSEDGKAGEKEEAVGESSTPVERKLEAPGKAHIQLAAGGNKEKPALEEPAPKQSSPTPGKEEGARPKPDPHQPIASLNQSSKERKEADDQQEEAQIVAEAEVLVKKSKVKQVAKIEGDHGVAAEQVIQHFHNYSPIKEQSKKEDNRSIVEMTRELPQNIPPFVSEDLPLYLEQLREDRLLLISCPDGQLPLAAANALVERLSLTKDEQKRFLDFNRNDEESANLNIYFFLERKDDLEEQTAIVIDAVNRKADPFLDSLIYDATPSSLTHLTAELRHDELLMVCLVEAAEVERRLANLKRERKLDNESMFTLWQVPFLEPLLKQYFPDRYVELAEQILRQRREQPMRWSEDDRDFCSELKSLLKKGRLLEKLNEAETPQETVLASTIFKGNDPLPDTVAYVGTFFPDLSPQEFVRVVNLLLGTRTKLVLVPAEKTNEEGKIIQVEIQKELPLVQVWQDSQDRILDQCHLVTTIKNSTRVIVFDDHRLRENMQEHLERKHPLYLEGQFECVQKMGLLFDPSAKIAGNVMRLVISMAACFAEDFIADWLLEIMAELEAGRDDDDEALTHASENPIFQMVKETNPTKAHAKIYQRIAELLRKILEEDRLQGIIEGLMQRLMSARLHDSVLALVRRIKFAPGFDAFKWLKQLLDQGNADTRQEAYEYIYFSVKEMGVRGYQVLEDLEAWLPKEDRHTRDYSYSNLHSLRLLLDLSSETLENFDPKNYGLWPTAYSLLAFKDVETARRYLQLLTRWLFHPGMKHAFIDFGIEVDINTLNSALIAEWNFILLAPTDAATNEKSDRATRSAQSVESQIEKAAPPHVGIEALTVRNILLEQVLAQSSRAQQREMLEYWNALKERMLMLSNLLCVTPNTKEYKETIWKRRLLKDLISDFRALRSQTSTEQQQQAVNV